MIDIVERQGPGQEVAGRRKTERTHKIEGNHVGITVRNGVQGGVVHSENPSIRWGKSDCPADSDDVRYGDIHKTANRQARQKPKQNCLADLHYYTPSASAVIS